MFLDLVRFSGRWNTLNNFPFGLHDRHLGQQPYIWIFYEIILTDIESFDLFKICLSFNVIWQCLGKTTSVSDVETTSIESWKRKSNRRSIIDVDKRRRNDVTIRRQNNVEIRSKTQIESTLDYRRLLSTLDYRRLLSTSRSDVERRLKTQIESTLDYRRR